MNYFLITFLSFTHSGQSLYLVDFEKKFIDKAMSEREKRLRQENASGGKSREAREIEETLEYREDNSKIHQDEEW